MGGQEMLKRIILNISKLAGRKGIGLKSLVLCSGELFTRWDPE